MGLHTNLRLALAPLLLLVGCQASPSADADRIGELIDGWNRAWVVKDPVLAASSYSEAATFTNAFGFHRVGRAAIEEYLTEVFSFDFVMAGESREVERRIRFLSPTVAVATTVIERTGQRTANDASLGTRRTSHLRVFARSGDQWRLESHLVSDARDTERARH